MKMSEWGDKDETFEMLEKVGDKNKVWTKAKKINSEQENPDMKNARKKKNRDQFNLHKWRLFSIFHTSY